MLFSELKILDGAENIYANYARLSVFISERSIEWFLTSLLSCLRLEAKELELRERAQ